MPGGSAGTSGASTPANQGVEFDQEQLDSTTDPEDIFSDVDETTSIIIRALPGNAGNVFVGFDGSVTANNGFPLEAGDTLSMDLDVGEQDIFIIPASAGDSVAFLSVR